MMFCICQVPHVSPPPSPKQKRGENAASVGTVSSTLDQPLSLAYNPYFPSSHLVETPSMQQENALTLSSSEQDGESLLFCLKDDSGDEVAQKYVPTEQDGESFLFCLQEDSGDEVAQNYVPTDQSEVMMEEESSHSSLSSHYASPPLTPAYGSQSHLNPMNGNTILYSPWPVSTTLSPWHTTPLHHINCSPPNSSPIMGMLYSESPFYIWPQLF